MGEDECLVHALSPRVKKLGASRKKFLIRARNSLQFNQEEKRTERRTRVASPSLRKPRALLKSIGDEIFWFFGSRQIRKTRGPRPSRGGQPSTRLSGLSIKSARRR